MSIILAIIILFICFRKPVLGLALLLQTNILRAVISINYKNPCFTCSNEPDIILGAITPILAFIVIILSLSIKRRLIYVFDEYDLFFFYSVLVLFLTSLFSIDIVNSLLYCFKFVFIGASYFFMIKIIMLNSKNSLSVFREFLNYSFKIAVFFSFFGGILYLLKGQDAFRLTLPGVHAIPFSQLIGLGVVISFLIFITDGKIFGGMTKRMLGFNKIILPIVTLVLFATNTRGIMLSAGLAVLFYLFFSRVKIKKRTLYISGALMLFGLIVAIKYIDFEVLFSRILYKGTDKSLDDRLIAYNDSIRLFLEYPFGIGPNSFKHYSILPYPHNFFLENIAQYGIFGLLMSLYFLILTILMLYVALKNFKYDKTFILIYALYVYFAVEIMFSFTLWMHKGLYLTMGIFAAYHYSFKKRQSSYEVL